MELLTRISLVIGLIGLPSCYAPELRDCAVRCASARDCATGQVCGVDGFCAAPERADRCAQLPTGDAARPDASEDAPVVDAPPADAPLDAPWLGLLRVKVDGRGRVVVIGHGTCDGSDDDDDDDAATLCSFPVPLGVLLTLQAIADEDHRFDKWTGEPCRDQGPTCVTTPTAPETSVGVRYRKD